MTGAETFRAALQFTLSQEGGFNESERSYQGVLQDVYDGYRRDHGLPTRDVRQMSAAERDAIYEAEYWIRGSCAQLASVAPAIAIAHFDCVVNMGVAGGARVLQEAVGVNVDGIVGTKTLAQVQVKASAQGARVVWDAMLREREARYRAIAAANPAKFSTWLPIWLRRVADLRAHLSGLSAAPGTPVVDGPITPSGGGPGLGTWITIAAIPLVALVLLVAYRRARRT